MFSCSNVLRFNVTKVDLRGMFPVKIRGGFLFTMTGMYLLWRDMTEMNHILPSNITSKAERRKQSPICLKLHNTRNIICTYFLGGGGVGAGGQS